MSPSDLDRDACYRALSARDARFDGVFFVGVETTGVYCRPVCPARTPRASRCRFFRRPIEAEKAGFRACFRCRPEVAPGEAPSDAVPRLVQRALQRIEEGCLDEGSLDDLAAELAVSSRHLRRSIQDELGASPIELAQSRRLAMAKRLLADSRLSVTQVAYASGFRSLRRFNEAFATRFGRTPSELARGRTASAAPEPIELRLDARMPYAHAPLFEFLRARAVAGVEVADAHSYRRVVRLDGERSEDLLGWLAARFDAARGRLSLSLAPELAPRLAEVAARARRLFDLDAGIAAIDARLGADPRFADQVRAVPGVRVPGAFDGFEVAVRIILGQQISVAAATTLAGRVARRFGAPLPPALGAPEGLSCAFPSAAAIAAAAPDALAELGVVPRRARAIVTLAQAVAARRIRLGEGPTRELERALCAIDGVGPWTASAVAMRVARDPDAFMASDLHVRRALGDPRASELFARSAGWAPFRAYAVMRLWLSLANESPKETM